MEQKNRNSRGKSQDGYRLKAASGVYQMLLTMGNAHGKPYLETPGVALTETPEH